MAIVAFWLSALLTLFIVLAALDALIGGRRLRNLHDVSPDTGGPLVSVIVAARNEERGIEEALGSLLRLAYPSLELIVVNDRSTDHTGQILTRLAEQHPRLSVLTVETLPQGWLGKNHALALGASRARGELLLFTDADVVFEPTVVGRAVRVLREEDLDHLTALPDVIARGVALTTLVLSFGVLFTFHTRPWKARDPRSRHHIGIGAFNLIRARAYARLGTHAAIAMRVDDDLRLGRAVKAAGLRQDVVRAPGLLTVEWYTSASDMVDGLMKNAFAGVNFSVTAVIGSTAALVAFTIWPWVALLTTTGALRRMAAVSVLVFALVLFRHARATRVSPVYVLLFPLGVLGFIWILWRSAALALSRGSISWRGTAYPLSLMRQAPAAVALPSSSGGVATDLLDRT